MMGRGGGKRNGVGKGRLVLGYVFTIRNKLVSNHLLNTNSSVLKMIVWRAIFATHILKMNTFSTDVASFNQHSFHKRFFPISGWKDCMEAFSCH